MHPRPKRAEEHAISDTIKALTETVRGRIITASDPDYDDARAVYNAMHDRSPVAVVQCTDSAEVMAVIAAARDSGVDLAIRGGGHSVPGFSTVDNGLVIDLSSMEGVRAHGGVQVDPAKTVARVGGVATWGMSITRPTRSAWPPPAGSSPRPGWPASTQPSIPTRGSVGGYVNFMSGPKTAAVQDDFDGTEQSDLEPRRRLATDLAPVARHTAPLVAVQILPRQELRAMPWSVYRAELAQPVATSRAASNGSDTRKPLPWVATDCRRRCHVKEGHGEKGLPRSDAPRVLERRRAAAGPRPATGHSTPTGPPENPAHQDTMASGSGKHLGCGVHGEASDGWPVRLAMAGPVALQVDAVVLKVEGQ
jgi:hypothetical protein